MTPGQILFAAMGALAALLTLREVIVASDLPRTRDQIRHMCGAASLAIVLVLTGAAAPVAEKWAYNEYHRFDRGF